MKKLHLLVIKSWLGPFIMTFFIALFILLMQFLWKYIDDLVGKGLEWYIIAELMFYASASLVPMALPLAILLSSLMTFGNLGEHLELAACKSSGISLQRVMFPLIIATALISVGAFYFANNVLPVSNLKMGTLLYDIQHQRPALNIKPGFFYSGIPNYVIKVKGKSEDGKSLDDILIYDHSDRQGNRKVIVADSGRMETTADERYMLLTLYDGHSYEEVEPKNRRSDTHPHQRSFFKSNTIRFDLSEFQLQHSDEAIFKNNYQMCNVNQLRDQTDTLYQKLTDRRKELGTSLVKNFGYWTMKKTNTETPNNDTLMRHIPVDPDILANFNKDDVSNILQTASNMARSNKMYVYASTQDHEGRIKMIRRYEIELHRKYTVSVACFILFFIGAPLGAIIRKGGLGMPAVVSIIFFVIYHSISMIGEKFVKQGGWDPFWGMWMASMILLPIGVFLTYKATRDSVILDMSTYLKPFQKISAFINKRFGP